MICPKCQFEQADSKTCVHCGVIFAKYQAYLDRQTEIRENENNIENEEKNLAEKVSACFTFLIQPWKPGLGLVI